MRDASHAAHAELQNLRTRGRRGNGNRDLAGAGNAQHDELAGLVAKGMCQVVFQEAQREEVIVLHHFVNAHDSRHVRLVWITADDWVVSGDFVG